jgi:uncharacterized protein YjbJ (UPF0337 family)
MDLAGEGQGAEMNQTTKKRVQGVVDEVAGKVKKTIGATLGNERLEAEGRATELKGEAEQEAAKGLERVKGLVEVVTGAAKKKLGQAIDDEQLEVEGKARELKGEARRAANR